MMLAPIKLTLSLIGRHNRYPVLLAGNIGASKHLGSQDSINRTLFNYYHSTQPSRNQESESPSAGHVHPPPRDKKPSLLDKAKSAQIQNEFKTLTLANLITLSRAAMAPAMGYFVMNGMHSEAVACMAYVVVSDLVDKVVAVKTRQASPLHAILDSLSDKLVLSTTFIAMYNMSMIPLWAVKAYVFKDLAPTILAGVFRYYGFNDKPTLKQFLNFNGYPTYGLRPFIIERVGTGVLYALIITHMAMAEHLHDPAYSWHWFIWQATALINCCVIIGARLVRLPEHRFVTRPMKS